MCCTLSFAYPDLLTSLDICFVSRDSGFDETVEHPRDFYIVLARY